VRIAEKTIELNFCKDLPKVMKQDLLWFGLTQKQEAKAGFDACTKVGSKLYIFQFKASNHYVGGAHRFHGPHHQMQALRNRVKNKRLVYYAFPAIGDTSQIKGPGSIISGAQYLDVATLPASIPMPIAHGKKTPRKNMQHYIDVYSGYALIHSDPFKVELSSSEQMLESDPMGASITREFDNNFELFWRFIKEVRSNGMYGAAAV
jgi:hypothetical protein